MRPLHAIGLVITITMGLVAASPSATAQNTKGAPLEVSEPKTTDSEAIVLARDDLIAQQGMNYSTQIVAGVAVWQLVISFAGTIALIFTISQTQRSLLLSGKMLESQTISAQHQLKAYIAISSTDLTGWDTGDVMLTLELKNTGQTPARRLNASINGEYMPEVDTSPAWVDPGPDVDDRELEIMPGQSISVHSPIELTPAQRNSISNKDAGIYLTGIIEYCTIFGEKVSVRRSIVYWGPEGKVRRATKSNNFTQYEREEIRPANPLRPEKALFRQRLATAIKALVD